MNGNMTERWSSAATKVLKENTSFIFRVEVKKVKQSRYTP
jgi:hypothetical protein